MKKAFVIHPFLFAAFPILFLFSHNMEEVSFLEALPSLVITLSFTLFLVLLIGLVLKESKKAGIITFTFLVLFFSYGRVFDLIKDLKIAFLSNHKHLMLIWGVIFICCTYLIIRTRRNLNNFTNILNIASFAMVVIPAVNIGIYKFQVRGAWEYNNRSTEQQDINITGSEELSSLRDIYYIILDGYPSSSTLKEIYDYNNHEFIDYLSDKGFYVASESRSNYSLTFLSLASSLNMKYVRKTEEIKSWQRDVPNQMIRNNKVLNLLKPLGYKYIQFTSGWKGTSSNKYADLEVKCIECGNRSRWFKSYRWDEFTMVLIQTTMLRPLEGYLIEEIQRAQVLCSFAKLAEMPEIEGHKFVFVHFMPPHPPYLFDANGEKVPKKELKLHGKSVWTKKELYVDQLIFVNKKVKELVDRLLSRSKVQPIIILQADHGTCSTFFGKRGTWGHPGKINFIERMRIFNAYYLPAGGDALLYKSITPVNTFRVIFNFYFGMNYKLLDDRSYFSNYGRPYFLDDVTNYVVYD